MSLETQQLAQTFGHINYLWEIYKKHVFWRFLTLRVQIWSQIAEKFSSSWDIKIVVFVCPQLYDTQMFPRSLDLGNICASLMLDFEIVAVHLRH